MDYGQGGILRKFNLYARFGVNDLASTGYTMLVVEVSCTRGLACASDSKNDSVVTTFIVLNLRFCRSHCMCIANIQVRMVQTTITPAFKPQSVLHL